MSSTPGNDEQMTLQELISIYSELKILYNQQHMMAYPYPQAMNRLSDLITNMRDDLAQKEEGQND